MSDTATNAMSLSKLIAPLLAGHGALAQSAALADLVSLWLAGMPKEARETAFALWSKTVRELVPESIEQVFGGDPPAGWEA